MDAMQRFNRISAVICLLLSCAPSAYAQDNLYGETMGAAVPQAKLAGVYPHGHSGLQDPAKALAGFHRAASQGDVEAQYNLAKMYENQDSVLFKLHVPSVQNQGPKNLQKSLTKRVSQTHSVLL